MFEDVCMTLILVVFLVSVAYCGEKDSQRRHELQMEHVKKGHCLTGGWVSEWEPCKQQTKEVQP